MKKIGILCAAVIVFLPSALFATGMPEEDYMRGTVTHIVEERSIEVAGSPSTLQILGVTISTGPEKGKTVVVEHGKIFVVDAKNKLSRGDKIVLSKSSAPGAGYMLLDVDRTMSLALFTGIFFACALVWGQRKGMTSVLGLLFSVTVIGLFIIPGIASGWPPLAVTAAGAALIALVSLFLAHGFNKQTLIAYISTMITFAFAIGLAFAAVSLTQLSGLAADETFFLQTGALPNLNFQGLLLGGILLGALGVLDDITTAQVAVVFELHEANPSLPRRELAKRALRVGREHIASLVNTLVLAYVGAGLPALLLFSVNSALPFWVSFNSEFIAEEAVRTLVGSTALVLAVPTATYLAVRLIDKTRKRDMI